MRRHVLTLLMLALLTAISVWGQGVAITIVMKKISRNIDDRFVEGRFFWKPILNPMFRSARAGMIPGKARNYNFAPPFSIKKETE